MEIGRLKADQAILSELFDQSIIGAEGNVLK